MDKPKKATWMDICAAALATIHVIIAAVFLVMMFIFWRDALAEQDRLDEQIKARKERDHKEALERRK